MATTFPPDEFTWDDPSPELDACISRMVHPSYKARQIESFRQRNEDTEAVVRRFFGLDPDPEAKRPRRGPVPGTVCRYATADRALFDEMTRLIRDGVGSATAAAQQLAEAGKVAGTGISTPKSRAARLVKAYKAYLRQTTH
jgi:hypothetical protein